MKKLLILILVCAFSKPVLSQVEGVYSQEAYAIPDNYAHDLGLINGYLGINLALRSYNNQKYNQWEEIFMA